MAVIIVIHLRILSMHEHDTNYRGGLGSSYKLYMIFILMVEKSLTALKLHIKLSMLNNKAIVQ